MKSAVTFTQINFQLCCTEFFSVLNQINSFYIAASFTGIQSNIILPYVCISFSNDSRPSGFFKLITILYACQTSAIGILYPYDGNS